MMYNENQKAGGSLELVSMIRRRWWVVLLSVFVVLLLVVFYNEKTVPVYRGSTKVIFEKTDQMVEGTLLGGFSEGNFIANQIEEMKTKAFAEEVVASLSGQVKKRFFYLPHFKPEYKRDRFLVKTVQENLSFNQVRGTEVVNIAFDCEDRYLAQVVTNAAADVLIQRNLTVRRQQYSNVKNFIEEQFEIVKQRLQESEQRLKEFKERENITSLEDQSREILERITQAEIIYNEVRSTRKEVQEKLTAIQKKLDAERAGLSESIVKTSSPLSMKLKERLVELEVTYSNLQVQGFPESNPKMHELRAEIEKIKRSLVEETLKLNKDENLKDLMDPFAQIRRYMEETITLEFELQALTAKANNLRALLNRYSEQLKKLPEKELTLVRLMRDKEVNNKLYMTLLEERERARIKEASEIGNIRVLERAQLPLNPIRPKKVLNLVLGFVTGSFLGMFLSFMFEYFNNKIRTQEDVERELGLPVIAVIPRQKREAEALLLKSGENGAFSSKYSYYNSVLFDAYSLLSFALDKEPGTCSTVMITSTTPNEGKSTIATLLAIATAQRGRRTLLVDGDLRKPTLHTFFHVPREPGLTNLLLEFRQRRMQERRDNGASALPGMPQPMVPAKIPSAVDLLRDGLIQTQEKNLLLLPSGFIPTNSVRIWSTSTWEDIFKGFSEIVDLVIVDAPPILGVADTTMMARYVQHILFCVAANFVDVRTLKRAFKIFTETIHGGPERILGAVLNKADITNLYGSYKYYRYYAQKEELRQSPELPSSDFTKSNHYTG